MKKILFVHHATGWGGAPNSLIKLINGIDKCNFQVTVLLLKNSVVAGKLTENGINFQLPKSIFYKKLYHYFTHSEAGYVKWYQVYRFIKLSIIWLLSRYFFADKELGRFEYDIVHLNSSVLTDWLAPASKKGKVIIHIREPFRKGKFDFLHKFFSHQMKLYADKIVAISHDNARRINIPEKTTVIYNYAELPEEPSPENSYFSKRVLYLGGSASIKGFYTLVEALDYLNDDIKILFAGNYSKTYKGKTIKVVVKKFLGIGRKQRSALQKIKNHKNAMELGLIYNTDNYFRECCCLISPFTVSHFPRPVIEAFLYKKPVIVSDVECMAEIVTHNENGLIFKKNDAKALADSINYLVKNPKKASQMGERGYKTAIQKFTDFNINDLVSIYETI